MKKPFLKKWALSENVVGLLFFAENLNEMLFHHTVDSFKAPALNLHSNILELRSLAYDLYNNLIWPNSLQHVFEELTYRINKDPALSKQQSQLYLEYIKYARSCLERPIDLLSTVNALLLEVHKNYWNSIKSALIGYVMVGTEKEKISLLSASLVNEIELRGYNKHYLYFMTINFFFNKMHPPLQINSPNQLKEFLDLFETETIDWQVIYRASLEFSNFKQYAEPFKFSIIDKIPPDIDFGDFRGPFLKENKSLPLFIAFKKINAKDRFTAAYTANSYLEHFVDICCFHEHILKPQWSNNCIVGNENANNYSLIKPAPDPMKRGVAVKVFSVENIGTTIELMYGKHNFDSSSIYLLSKAIDYHRAAIQTSVSETQLVSLWAAIEGLLPPPNSNQEGQGLKKARIEQYIDFLLPSLTLLYAEKIFRDVSDSLKNYSKEVRELIQCLPGDDSFILKTTRLLVCKNHNETRTGLFKLLENSPLLRYRCHWFFEHFKSNKRIKKSLKKHKERIQWHIQRIYTTRNQIVHSASALPYLHTLVENLHTYFDFLLDAIFKVGIYSKSKISIATAIKLLQIYEKYYYESLNGPKKYCTEENYMQFLFGEDSPLRPKS